MQVTHDSTRATAGDQENTVRTANTPTREALAIQLERDADCGDFGFGAAVQPFRDAAALLRQSCATCDHFNIEGLTPAHCYSPHHWVRVPNDGSGFCWLWSADTKAAQS